MSDRELLEAAAMAAGYEIQWERVFCHKDHVAYYNVSFGDYWNSLYSPGDALRLAVALRIDLTYFAEFVRADFYAGTEQMKEVYAEYDADPLASTCRAITRAAADIGRTK